MKPSRKSARLIWTPRGANRGAMSTSFLASVERRQPKQLAQLREGGLRVVRHDSRVHDGEVIEVVGADKSQEGYRDASQCEGRSAETLTEAVTPNGTAAPTK
eukprot:35153-Heterocapsa_arctica.AAC.1